MVHPRATSSFLLVCFQQGLTDISPCLKRGFINLIIMPLTQYSRANQLRNGARTDLRSLTFAVAAGVHGQLKVGVRDGCSTEVVTLMPDLCLHRPTSYGPPDFSFKRRLVCEP